MNWKPIPGAPLDAPNPPFPGLDEPPLPEPEPMPPPQRAYLRFKDFSIHLAPMNELYLFIRFSWRENGAARSGGSLTGTISREPFEGLLRLENKIVGFDCDPEFSYGMHMIGMSNFHMLNVSRIKRGAKTGPILFDLTLQDDERRALLAAVEDMA